MPITLQIPEFETYDESACLFSKYPAVDITLEHSLYAISKWESIWNKPFLTGDKKTNEEVISYIKCMDLDENRDPIYYQYIPARLYKDIENYIAMPMTATWFRDSKPSRRSRDIITAEIIYYWMIASNIPFECDRWHFNKLMTLIRVCGEKNKPPKKMSKNAVLRQNSALNAARKERFKTRG